MKANPFMSRKKPPTEAEYFKDFRNKLTIFGVFVAITAAAPFLMNKIQQNMPSTKSDGKRSK
eukprot:CAMPEP_0202704192 /NCGR_PEP_ID=MMETSP1385-20130828/16917_1 /ASSEMBLY_ACC=CAM_ASM_000861 /TAXON_ID=933848 /ORGANISM="Elphidium margaritaceum" /LENGTH=61 /DNA_ID=CAMNT_0049362163 /DNA_START=29 /DNA_END=214 /DNA_ORIENTATION=-